MNSSYLLLDTFFLYCKYFIYLPHLVNKYYILGLILGMYVTFSLLFIFAVYNFLRLDSCKALL